MRLRACYSHRPAAGVWFAASTSPNVALTIENKARKFTKPCAPKQKVEDWNFNT